MKSRPRVPVTTALAHPVSQALAEGHVGIQLFAQVKGGSARGVDDAAVDQVHAGDEGHVPQAAGKLEKPTWLLSHRQASGT